MSATQCVLTSVQMMTPDRKSFALAGDTRPGMCVCMCVCVYVCVCARLGRYPFLLVDKILECVPGEYAVGVKCITSNEPQFTGHFPDRYEGKSN